MDFKELSSKLIKNNITISSIESLTGGLFSYNLTKYSGVSKIFNGSKVTYSNSAKINAGVSRKIVEKYGVVSKEVAIEMVKTLDADIGVSFTGNAGPTSLENKEVGKVFIGIKNYDKFDAYEFQFNGDRESIRDQSIKEALNLLEKIL